MALLTGRELEVLKLSYLERKDIAEKLCVAPHTIETHVYNYLKKLGARNRTEAIIIALKMDIVTLEDFEVDYDKGNE